MATTLAIEAPVRITLSATPGNLTRVDLPKGARVVWVQFFDAAGTTPAAGKLAKTGTDAAAIGTAFFTVGVGAAFPMSIPIGKAGTSEYTSIYLASAIVSAIVEVWAVRE